MTTSGAVSLMVMRYIILQRNTFSLSSQCPLQAPKSPPAIAAPSSLQPDVHSSLLSPGNLAAQSSRSGTKSFAPATSNLPPFSQPPPETRHSFPTSLQLQPNFVSGYSQAVPSISQSKPNYNILLPKSVPQNMTHTSPLRFPVGAGLAVTPLPPGGTLAPLPAQSSGASSSKKLSKDEWGDFDPLS